MYPRSAEEATDLSADRAEDVGDRLAAEPRIGMAGVIVAALRGTFMLPVTAPEVVDAHDAPARRARRSAGGSVGDYAPSRDALGDAARASYVVDLTTIVPLW